MTIDDNVNFLNEAKKLYEDIANNPSLNETIKTYFIIESLENAVAIMRRYQKIEQILNNTFQNIAKEDERYAYEWLGDIRKVLEDDDNK